MFVCLFVCLFACLFVCLFVCLFGGFCFCFVLFGVVLLLFFFGGEGSINRATSSENLKFVRFLPSTLIPLDMSTSLKISSLTAVNSLGESRSPCLTPLFTGNSSDTIFLNGSILWLGCGCFVIFLRMIRLC